MSRLRFILLFGAIAGLATSPAQAFILAPEQLLRLMVEARLATKQRDMSLQLTTYLAGRDQPVEERLYLKRPERSRLVQQDEPVQVAVEREGIAAGGPEGSLRTLPGPTHNLLPLLLFPKGPTVDDMVGRILAGLRAIGIDVTVGSLGHQGEAVAYIIGARSWEPDRPQIWLDKVNYQPVRLISQIIEAGGPPHRRELRLLDYGQGPGGPTLPQFFEELRDGQRQRRAEVTGVHFNQSLPETLFEWSRRR